MTGEAVQGRTAGRTPGSRMCPEEDPVDLGRFRTACEKGGSVSSSSQAGPSPMSSLGESCSGSEQKRRTLGYRLCPWTLQFPPRLEIAYGNAATLENGGSLKAWPDMLSSALCTSFWLMAVASCISRAEPWKAGVCAVAGVAATLPGILQVRGNRSGKNRYLAWGVARTLLITSTVLADIPASLADWGQRLGVGSQPGVTALLSQALLHLCVPALFPLRFSVHLLTIIPTMASAIFINRRACCALVATGGPLTSVETIFTSLQNALGSIPAPCTSPPPEELAAFSCQMLEGDLGQALGRGRVAMCFRGGVWLLLVSNFASTVALYVAELKSREWFAAARGCQVPVLGEKIQGAHVVGLVVVGGGFFWKVVEAAQVYFGI